MKAIWDEAFLKQHERNAREDALAVQSDEDWKSAELLLEREMSDVCDGFVDCPLPACRRAHRCTGNRPICLPWCPVEYKPGGEQERFEQFYAEIQRERRDAAAEQREPYVERVMTDRVHVEDDEIEDESPARPAESELERNLQIAREALRRDDTPSQSLPQPQLAKAEPPAAPPPVAPATPPPPAAWQPNNSPEMEERTNQIGADDVAGQPMPRPAPRLPLPSDNYPWSTPPWKDPR